MQETLFNLQWWLLGVVLPVLIGLFWLNWRTRRDLQKEIDDVRHEGETGLRWLRDHLAAYKLEVAKSYASIAYLKEVERRLTSHLIRIEDKIDSVIEPGRRAPR